jgi:hypothetical protein
VSSSAFDDLSGIAFTDGDDAFAAIAGRVAPTACTRTTGSKVKIAKEARAVRRAEEAARAARDARDAAKAATNRDPAADDPAPPAGNHAPAPRHTDDNPAPTGGRGGNETGDDAPAAETAGGSVVRHYTTDAAANSISKEGVLRPGASGKTWLTPDEYASGAEARAKLALNKTPDGYYEIPMCRVQCPSGPSTVEPYYGQPGGGTEITTEYPIDVGDLPFIRFGGN